MNHCVRRLMEQVKYLLEKYSIPEGFVIKEIETEDKTVSESPFKTEFPRIRIRLSSKDDETCVFFKSYTYDREEYLNAISENGKIVSFGEGEFRGGIPTASAESRMKNFLKKILPKKH